jgi:hypothetical protein
MEILRSNSMRALFVATPMFAGVLISSNLVALAEESAASASAARLGAPIIQVQPRPVGAPAVDVQPRAGDFSPHSAANEAEQEKLSTFDAKQQKRDEALDKKLNICRC